MFKVTFVNSNQRLSTHLDCFLGTSTVQPFLTQLASLLRRYTIQCICHASVTASESIKINVRKSVSIYSHTGLYKLFYIVL